MNNSMEELSHPIQPKSTAELEMETVMEEYQKVHHTAEKDKK